MTDPILAPSELRREATFPRLSPQQLARMCGCGRRRRVEVGDLLFDQGEIRTNFFVLLSGRLEVVQPAHGGELPITLHGPGEFTGEVDMLTGRPSLVRGRVREAGELLEIDRAGLRTLVQVDAELGELLMRAFILRRVSLIVHGHGDAVLVGSIHSAATLRPKEFLTRNSHPFTYIDIERDASVGSLLEQFHVGVDEVLVVILRDTIVLRSCWRRSSARRSDRFARPCAHELPSTSISTQFASEKRRCS